MAYIILAAYEAEELTKAADWLRGSGHKVEVVRDGQKVISLLQTSVPDILVMATFLASRDGFEILEVLYSLYPQSKTRIIWLTSLAPCGEPSRGWIDPRIHNYILEPYTHWHVVLAVEQLLYREITLHEEAAIQLHLIELTRALSWYIEKHNGGFPSSNSMPTIKAELKSVHPLIDPHFTHPGTGEDFLFNPNLAGEQWRDIRHPETVPAFYETTSSADGKRWVAYLGPTRETIYPRVEHIAEADFDLTVEKSSFKWPWP
jgi:CheY-like chemotaxis protein